MMFVFKNKYSVLSFFFIVVFLFSCSTSNEVVSNKLFQKRKYKKGWYKNSSRNYAHKARKQKKSFSFNKPIDSSPKEEVIASKSITEIQKNLKLESKKKEKNYFKNKVISYKTPNEIIVPIDKIIYNTKNLSFQSLERPVKIEKIESPPIDRSDSTVRVLLAILGLLIILFTGISPLAIWIALGRCEALRINSMLYLITLGLTIILIALLILALGGGGSEIVVGIVGIITLVMLAITLIHGIVSIIRGH